MLTDIQADKSTKLKHTKKSKNGACDCVRLCVGGWFRVSAWRVGAWVCGCGCVFFNVSCVFMFFEICF